MRHMKKKYSKPVVEIIIVDTADIIATSATSVQVDDETIYNSIYGD